MSSPEPNRVDLGPAEAEHVAHWLPDVGPRVFVALTGAPFPVDAALSITPEKARQWADALKIAACHAEAIAKRKEREQCRTV